MIFQFRDGALRLYDGKANTPYHHEVLFTNANLSGPIARGKTTERLILDRGTVDANAHYVQSNDDVFMAPLRVTFSCILEDLGHSATLESLLRGNATVDAVAITSTSGDTQNVAGINNPAFEDSTKRTLNLEVLFDASSGGVDFGYKWAEVYFPPEQQTLADGADGAILNIVGDCYGTITKIVSFSTPTTAIG